MVAVNIMRQTQTYEQLIAKHNMQLHFNKWNDNVRDNFIVLYPNVPGVFLQLDAGVDHRTIVVINPSILKNK